MMEVGSIKFRCFLNMTLNYSTLALLSVIIVILFIPKLRKAIKCCLKYGTFCGYMAVVSIIGIPVSLRAPFTPKPMLAFTKLVEPVSKILGIEWELKNTDNVIENGKSAIFVANHQTLFDIVGMMHLWNKKSVQCTAISRNLFFWAWPVGLAMWLGGIVFVKRNSGSKDTITGVNQAAETIFKRKVKLWVYAEGTRNSNPETLLPFKKGAFRIAITHQVPIIPIVYSPYYFVSWKDRYFDSGKVIIEVLEPISTTGLTLDNLDDLIGKTHAAMSKKNKELRNEIHEFITSNKTS